MIKYIFFMLLTIHLLCDFYLQSEKMAECKKNNILWVLLHSVLYAVVAAIVFVVVMPGLPWKYIGWFVISHMIIDISKYIICHFLKYIKKDFT